MLTFAKDDIATLTDEGGKVLWSGPLLPSHQGFLKNAAKPLPPYLGRSTTDLYNYLYGKD